MQLSENCELVELDKVLDYLEVNQSSFINICITAGCDYLPNVKGVGINKAKTLVKENDDFIHHLSQIPGASQGYKDRFVSACAVFQHQTIIDPESSTTMPINKWTEAFDDESKANLQRYCGVYPLMPFHMQICQSNE